MKYSGWKKNSWWPLNYHFYPRVQVIKAWKADWFEHASTHLLPPRAVFPPLTKFYTLYLLYQLTKNKSLCVNSLSCDLIFFSKRNGGFSKCRVLLNVYPRFFLQRMTISLSKIWKEKRKNVNKRHVNLCALSPLVILCLQPKDRR